MPDASRWTLVTVTYNSAHHLRSSWAGADLGGARWVVVDNCSSDGSAEVAEELGADVVRRQDNPGFSVGNNAGLRLVDSEWVAFVNPDVRIGPAADLHRLAHVATTTGGLVAPQLLNRDGTEQANARGVPTPLQKVANRGLHLPGSDHAAYARSGFSAPTYVAWVMGAALAGRTEHFRDLGGWDERYFIYYEDHDIGLRAWERGLPVVVDPEVRWTHDWQRATTRLTWAPWKHELRSASAFYRQHPSALSRRAFGGDRRYARLSGLLWRPVEDLVGEVG